MSDSKRRPRAARREAERAARALVRDRQKLALLEPGGAPDRPVVVETSAVIELQARSRPCPLCEGELRVEDHQAPSAMLRAVAVRCQRCHVARTLWFRIELPRAN